MRPLLAILLALLPGRALAGLHYSGEQFAELPSKWSGFLVDHRSLRGVGIEKPKGSPQSPLRQAYLKAAAKLESTKTKLTADEQADLGALYVRLNRAPRAVQVLRTASRQHPNHFRIASNLGTAWQLSGDLDQAAAALQTAVELAPEKLKPFEKYHLKLVQLRRKEGKKAAGLDRLFGDSFTGEPGKPRLPANAAAIGQYLALALPADGRLLWQLGEIANALGDVRTAAAILDGCVTEFAMAAPELREHRRQYRERTEQFKKKPQAETHKGAFTPRSTRPLIRKFDLTTLPPIRNEGSNPLPWGVIAETTVDREARPRFPNHLEKLDGKTVVILGFIQPLGEAREFNGFLLLEYPVGCWFCETPEPTGLVSVQLEAGKRTAARRGLVRITGILGLNKDNPEDFLFHVKNARIGEAE